MRLIDLGWSEWFEERFRPFGERALEPARVGREQEKGFLLYSERGELQAELSGRLRRGTVRRAQAPAVGDWVAVRVVGGAAAIEAVLPRRSRFSRKVAWRETEEQVVAANIDTVFLVSSLDREFNVRRIERYLTLAWDSGASPVILLNKADLRDDVEECVAEAGSVACGVPVQPVSAIRYSGLERIREHLGPGRTVAFVGSSGVGKSALINALLGEGRQRTAPVRESDGRGRHATKMRELFLLPQGGLLIDTPGMREIQLWADAEDLSLTFREIDEAARSCRFRDCSHQREPGCGVQGALAEGAVTPDRFESYLQLRAELRSLERRRAEKERLLGKRRREERRRSGVEEAWE